MTIVGDAYVRLRGDTSGFKADSEGGILAGVGDIAKKAALVLGGAFAVKEGVDFLKGTFEAATEANRVTAQTAAVIKSTGDASKVTQAQVEGLGKAIAAKTGIDHDQIQSGENMLLTFTNIRNETGKNNDIFNQATQTITDMSKALGQDMKSSAMQLGKALQDPEKGITALRRVGVTFTDQQKEQIAAMTKAGDAAGAQKIILGELNREFGGSAAAQATGVDKMKEKWREIQEEIGQRLVPIVNHFADIASRYLPVALDVAGRAFDALGDVFRPVIAAVQTIIQIFSDAGLQSRDMADGIDAAVGGGGRFTDAFTAVIDVAKEVVDWIQQTIATFEGGGVSMGATGDRIGRVFSTLWADISSALGAIQAIVAAAVAVITDLWDRFGQHLLDHLVTAWNAIVQTVQGALDILGGIFDLIKAILTGKWGDAWNALIEIFKGVWETIKGLVETAVNALSTIFGAAMAGISAAWGLIWHSLATAFSGAWAEVWGGIKGAWDHVISFFTHDAPAAITSAASGLWGGFKQAVIDAINWCIDKVNDFTAHLPTFHLPGTNITIEAPTVAHIGRQAGGFATGQFIAGEAGAELISLTPGGGAYVTPAHRTSVGPSIGSVTIPITVNAGAGADGEGIAQLVASVARNEITAALNDVLRTATAGARR